ncbi:hypothetical protein HS088_TW03G00741 [Tripterygium wilfordii]|uniref:Ubiquitin-like domain-containing protein n=1 Tax=Tripterygium wilfordii TaxID=458696 RepID=A0A7J7DVL8_TRIWF|nr:hypothetical protein HS088_TW03G00741 [Tripterygium wilfordii]
MAAAGVTFEIIGTGFSQGTELIFYTQMPLSATILDLKERIAEYYYVPVERQTLHCVETENLQDDRTIESYHFNPDNHVSILLIKPPVAQIENSDIEEKEGDKNTDAKDDIDQAKGGENNTDAKDE